MSLHTSFHAPRTTPSGRIQIGHKSGLLAAQAMTLSCAGYKHFSVNIKPPRHSFGLSLCLGLAITLVVSLLIIMDYRSFHFSNK